MKRSEINAIMRAGIEFLDEHQFCLPPFGRWTPREWSAKGVEASEIVEHRLGWDITDFGSNHFPECGLLLFTMRNGKSENLAARKGKLYAEKIMIVGAGQVTPMHFHWQKTEDIINRGGGRLIIQLYRSDQSGGLDGTEVLVGVDGIQRRVSAGDCVSLNPGESITLAPGLYHKFWGEGGRVLVGEVSTVNDDNSDNRFYEPVGRFPRIVEDETPEHLLTIDYPAYCKGAFNTAARAARRNAEVAD
jgi:D-lyxose ketol-isomerase